ncbi:sugar ABC transporter ATP-binding protein [Arthrobacter frigidicola]|nr:sugar ABC transporter ATP-binding protein [Arthrobacter frigidicola]
MNGSPILTLDNVSKAFGPVTVIDGVSVNVLPGKVQVLLGENGAGKSTLIKMMAGVHQPDGGRILIDGEEVQLPDTKASEKHGIATIHQELNLVGTMSIAENISLGRMPRRFGLVDKARMKEDARAALALIGLDLDVDRMVGELGIAHQQLVEIAKALSLNARMLILDEPTAALTKREIASLFKVVEDLRSRGVGMVFISHHLDEIAAIGDSVSVLRDGRFIAEVPATTHEDELVRLMVGRDIDQQFPRRREYAGPAETLLEVSGLSTKGMINNVSFSVQAGEVVALAGLVGAGRTEVIRAIAGIDPYTSGTISVRGKALPPLNVGAAIRAGIGHVPEDRKVQGLVLGAAVNENIGYATLAATARAGIVDFAGQRKRAQEVADKLRIRMSSLDQTVGSLSGGNQQKTVFARWIVAGATVLLLDEPTRGVDVGAKVEIYELINAITAAGGAVVMVSSELPEVLGMADRIVVMSGGHVSGQLPAESATQDSVMSLAVRDVQREIEDKQMKDES